MQGSRARRSRRCIPSKIANVRNWRSGRTTSYRTGAKRLSGSCASFGRHLDAVRTGQGEPSFWGPDGIPRGVRHRRAMPLHLTSPPPAIPGATRSPAAASKADPTLATGPSPPCPVVSSRRSAADRPPSACPLGRPIVIPTLRARTTPVSNVSSTGARRSGDAPITPRPSSRPTAASGAPSSRRPPADRRLVSPACRRRSHAMPPPRGGGIGIAQPPAPGASPTADGTACDLPRQAEGLHEDPPSHCLFNTNSVGDPHRYFKAHVSFLSERGQSKIMNAAPPLIGSGDATRTSRPPCARSPAISKIRSPGPSSVRPRPRRRALGVPRRHHQGRPPPLQRRTPILQRSGNPEANDERRDYLHATLRRDRAGAGRFPDGLSPPPRA